MISMTDMKLAAQVVALSEIHVVRNDGHKYGMRRLDAARIRSIYIYIYMLKIGDTRDRNDGANADLR